MDLKQLKILLLPIWILCLTLASADTETAAKSSGVSDKPKSQNVSSSEVKRIDLFVPPTTLRFYEPFSTRRKKRQSLRSRILQRRISRRQGLWNQQHQNAAQSYQNLHFGLTPYDGSVVEPSPEESGIFPVIEQNAPLFPTMHSDFGVRIPSLHQVSRFPSPFMPEPNPDFQMAGSSNRFTQLPFGDFGKKVNNDYNTPMMMNAWDEFPAQEMFMATSPLASYALPMPYSETESVGQRVMPPPSFYNPGNLAEPPAFPIRRPRPIEGNDSPQEKETKKPPPEVEQKFFGKLNETKPKPKSNNDKVIANLFDNQPLDALLSSPNMIPSALPAQIPEHELKPIIWNNVIISRGKENKTLPSNSLVDMEQTMRYAPREIYNHGIGYNPLGMFGLMPKGIWDIQQQQKLQQQQQMKLLQMQQEQQLRNIQESMLHNQIRTQHLNLLQQSSHLNVSSASRPKNVTAFRPSVTANLRLSNVFNPMFGFSQSRAVHTLPGPFFMTPFDYGLVNTFNPFNGYQGYQQQMQTSANTQSEVIDDSALEDKLRGEPEILSVQGKALGADIPRIQANKLPSPTVPSAALQQNPVLEKPLLINHNIQNMPGNPRTLRQGSLFNAGITQQVSSGSNPSLQQEVLNSARGNPHASLVNAGKVQQVTVAPTRNLQQSSLPKEFQQPDVATAQRNLANYLGGPSSYSQNHPGGILRPPTGHGNIFSSNHNDDTEKNIWKEFYDFKPYFPNSIFSFSGGPLANAGVGTGFNTPLNQGINQQILGPFSSGIPEIGLGQKFDPAQHHYENSFFKSVDMKVSNPSPGSKVSTPVVQQKEIVRTVTDGVVKQQVKIFPDPLLPKFNSQPGQSVLKPTQESQIKPPVQQQIRPQLQQQILEQPEQQILSQDLYPELPPSLGNIRDPEPFNHLSHQLFGPLWDEKPIHPLPPLPEERPVLPHLLPEPPIDNPLLQRLPLQSPRLPIQSPNLPTQSQQLLQRPVQVQRPGQQQQQTRLPQQQHLQLQQQAIREQQQQVQLQQQALRQQQQALRQLGNNRIVRPTPNTEYQSITYSPKYAKVQNFVRGQGKENSTVAVHDSNEVVEPIDTAAFGAKLSTSSSQQSNKNLPPVNVENIIKNPRSGYTQQRREKITQQTYEPEITQQRVSFRPRLPETLFTNIRPVDNVKTATPENNLAAPQQHQIQPPQILKSIDITPAEVVTFQPMNVDNKSVTVPGNKQSSDGIDKDYDDDVDTERHAPVTTVTVAPTTQKIFSVATTAVTLTGLSEIQRIPQKPIQKVDSNQKLPTLNANNKPAIRPNRGQARHQKFSSIRIEPLRVSASSQLHASLKPAPKSLEASPLKIVKEAESENLKASEWNLESRVAHPKLQRGRTRGKIVRATSTTTTTSATTEPPEVTVSDTELSRIRKRSGEESSALDGPDVSAIVSHGESEISTENKKSKRMAMFWVPKLFSKDMKLSVPIESNKTEDDSKDYSTTTDDEQISSTITTKDQSTTTDEEQISSTTTSPEPERYTPKNFEEVLTRLKTYKKMKPVGLEKLKTDGTLYDKKDDATSSDDELVTSESEIKPVVIGGIENAYDVSSSDRMDGPLQSSESKILGDVWTMKMPLSWKVGMTKGIVENYFKREIPDAVRDAIADSLIDGYATEKKKRKRHAKSEPSLHSSLTAPMESEPSISRALTAEESDEVGALALSDEVDREDTNKKTEVIITAKNKMKKGGGAQEVRCRYNTLPSPTGSIDLAKLKGENCEFYYTVQKRQSAAPAKVDPPSDDSNDDEDEGVEIGDIML